MLPITGPYTNYFVTMVRTVPPYGVMPFGDYQTIGFRQKRPYNLPLPFTYYNRLTLKVSTGLEHLQSLNSTGGIGYTQAFDLSNRFGDWAGPWIDSRVAVLRNRAAAKLQAKLSDTSSALTALAESRQTLGMIEKRLVTLLEFRKKFQKKQFKSAILTVLKGQRFRNRSKERKRRRRIEALSRKPPAYWKSKTLAQAWIETWFGWLPTIGDVQKGVEVLGREFPNEYIRSSSALPHDFITSDPSFTSKHSGKVWCTCGALVRVTNPNLFLASQLGLTNPIYTAFETIQFSWLLSWFNNLEQFFKQWSVFHGVLVESPYTTIGIADTVEFSFIGKPDGKANSVSFKRSLGLPEVTLQWKGLTRLSATRGATLSSLLALRLPRG